MPGVPSPLGAARVGGGGGGAGRWGHEEGVGGSHGEVTPGRGTAPITWC